MAESFPVTPGTGRNVAVDTIAGQDWQYVKLADGTADSTTPIVGDGNGLTTQGQVAHDAAVQGKLFLEGGRASDAVPTAVSADGDGVHAWRDRRGAAKVAMVDDAGDSVMDGITNSVRVNVVSGSAVGTEYADGTTQITPIGQMALWWDTSNVVRAVSAAKPFPVNVVAGGTSGTQYTDGTGTATIGTAVIWKDTSDVPRIASAAKPLPVQVVTSPGGSVLPDPVVNSSAVAVPLKFASVNATADGDNTVISGVASKKLRILGYALMATGAGTLSLKSAGTTVLGRVRASGDGAGAAYAGGVDAPACETATAEAFVINNPTGVDTVGHVSYIEV
jgi:hypothetical protein